MKKMCALLLVLAAILLFAVPAMAEEVKSEDIVILYTNDVHTYIDGDISYDVIAALKKELQEDYAYVLLVDAGDHIQGTAYGSMDKGETIIELMNAAGYDVATLGNHEFDYGMEGRIKVTEEWAQYTYLSCNFFAEKDGVRKENVLKSYELYEFGEQTVAIIGITTPETFSKSTPAYFQDENGKFIYGISGGADGEALYADVQTAIDEAESAGADIVIALGHLGVDPSSEPWTSEEVIANTDGLDAFIDGHSHTVEEGRTVADEGGDPVLLTQTGEYFGTIGQMVIDSETGEITTSLLTKDDLAELTPDAEVKTLKDDWIDAIDEQLGAVIGKLADGIVLDNYDEDGNRLVRKQETNTGDFAADALYYLFDNMDMDVDVAVMNGGGIRNKQVAGDLTYKICKNIHTFGNVACLQTVTGQQLLDALEWGARGVGTGEEIGGFLHVAGMTYRVDTSVESTVQVNENGGWAGGPTGAYRVCDVQVYDKETDTYEPLDLSGTYNLAGYNYTLRDLGDGFSLFSGAINVLDYVMEDYLVLANYVKGFEDGVVDAWNSPLLEKYPGMLLDYSTVYGSGRIQICACVDADQNHICDLCWRTLSECVDENPHDHSCDYCGDIYGYGSVGEDGKVHCDICGAVETYVGSEFLSVEYWLENGALFADTTLKLYAQEWTAAGEAVAGAVTVCWKDEDDNLIAIEEQVELDENGAAEVTFYGVPAEALNHGEAVFAPADPERYMPSSNGIVLEYVGYQVTVEDCITGCYINGVAVDSLCLLPGTEVVVELVTVSEGTFTCTSEYLKEHNIDVKQDAQAITFRLPETEPDGWGERTVDLAVGWTCYCGCVCEDTDWNHVCDQCEHEISTCVAYNEDHYCVYCGDFDVMALLDMLEIETETADGTFTVTWTAFPEVHWNEYEEAEPDRITEYVVTICNEDLGVEMRKTVAADAERKVVFSGLKNGAWYDISVDAEYPRGADGYGHAVGRSVAVELPAVEDVPSHGSADVPVRKPAALGTALIETFTDLDPKAWYGEAVEYVMENGLMNGVSEDRFDPYGTTNRAMIVTILWRLEGEPAAKEADFTDVEADSWYADAVNWAASMGIVEGYGDGRFGSMASITREQLAAILWRYAKYKGMDVSVGENTNILSYTDAFDVSDWAYAPLQWACGAGVVNGKDGALAPQASAVRVETAQMLFNFLG